MGRALALLLLLFYLFPRALAQVASCDATDLLFDFSDPGPLQTLTVGGESYYVANLASYLLLLSSTSPMRFPPTPFLLYTSDLSNDHPFVVPGGPPTHNKKITIQIKKT
ncbi:hypothetical protein [Thermus scotoductus]|uniref:hypothetical protein n=1 Tax=Thermus scotoductus TaxID=37636 RepID=UPI000F81331D|nr:hypothetical protein [Thermus scotoductus]RTH26303.1 hypothetical protein CSW36_07040 [Thermus scotoductus]